MVISIPCSTPEGSDSPDPEAVLANTLKDRRKWMRPGARYVCCFSSLPGRVLGFEVVGGGTLAI